MNNGRVIVVYTSVEFSFCMLKTPRHYLSAVLNYSKSLGYVSESAWRSVPFENVIRLLLGWTTVPVKLLSSSIARQWHATAVRRSNGVSKKPKKRQSLEANFRGKCKVLADFQNSFTCRL